MTNVVQQSLYCYKACVGVEDVHRIIQSSVFLSERILLPAAIVPHPHLTNDNQATITRRLRELREIGAVSFWEIEGQSRYLNKNISNNKVQRFTPDVVIPLDTYRGIYTKIVERLVKNREHFLGSAMNGSLDGIAEFVIGKHALWTMALREFLKTQHVIFDPLTANNTSRFFTDLLSAPDVAEGVVSRVMQKLSIPDLSMLNINQIEHCRKFLPTLRDYIYSQVPQEMEGTAFREAEVAERIADQIMEELFELAHQQLARKSELLTIAWKLGKIILSPVITRKYADKFFGWFGPPPPEAPTLVLLEVHRQLKNDTVFSKEGGR